MKSKLTLTVIFLIYSILNSYAGINNSISSLKEQAAAGNSEAALQLGNSYFYGLNTDKDSSAAFLWYLKSAEKDNKAAMFNTALCYDQGIGTKEDKILAIRWYTKAAAGGVIQAKYNMALYYRDGAKLKSDSESIVFKPDLTKAIIYFKECSDANFAPADRELAKLYFSGVEYKLKKDPLTAITYLNKAVALKDPEAIYMLAKIYIEKGKGFSEIVPLLKSASDGNIPEAQELLGICYECGNGVEQNKKKAMELYLSAAKSGLTSAQIKAADYYANGNIVEEDIFEAKKWYEKAAEQNNPYAYFVLGTYAENGIAEEKDLRKALQYYMKSAKAGFARAQYNVGVFYSKGIIVTKDDNLAVYWFKKAALQNEPAAQRELGYYYITGTGGLPQSYDYGLNWLDASKENGDIEADNFLNKIDVSN